ncbi:hypothetical protein FSF81_005695, partial [Escherichia coli]|nr:hypothetical protein [Escherichia coli]
HRALSEHKTLSVSWSHYPSSEELLSDNTLEKDENSPDNGFEVGEYNTYEAYNSEKQYFTREDYTYDYDLLNAI